MKPDNKHPIKPERKYIVLNFSKEPKRSTAAKRDAHRRPLETPKGLNVVTPKEIHAPPRQPVHLVVLFGLENKGKENEEGGKVRRWKGWWRLRFV